MRIADARAFQRGRERVAVELRVVAGARHGTYVNEPGYRMDRKQSNKLGERPRRMADCQHDGPGVLLDHYFSILETCMIGSSLRQRFDWVRCIDTGQVWRLFPTPSVARSDLLGARPVLSRRRLRT